METFCAAKHLQSDLDFTQKKRQALSELDPTILDPPMVEMVRGLNRLPHCYTLQSCIGHLVVPSEDDPAHWQRLPPEDPPARALYQLAYVALVVRNDVAGRDLRSGLSEIAQSNPAFIQMGSADWFWKSQGQVNSYVLQASPQRFEEQDRFKMEREEALGWLGAREQFTAGLKRLLG